ncbi:MAG: N-6 DNA methylase, partial [Alphaproteobacteria bacterium]|nr:N-6 DNA methylase [Alphaproteobacteria bacterium]
MKGNTSRANKQCSERRIIPMELIGSNSTILPFLESLRNSPLSIKDIIFNMAVSILRKNGFVSIENNTITGENPFLLEILEAFSQNFDSDLLNTEFPLSQPDFLDIAYQSLLKEGDKNQTGSYYTPESLTKKIPDINDTTTFLDPCCGTGNFLLAASSRIQDPSMLYGVDTDETACFIAKIKLIYRFRHIKFMPNIYNTDYLSMPETSQRFDVIATNPPWGAKVSKRHAKNCKHITSGESFSYFIVKTKVLLRKQGQCFFILPVSILNVSAHKDIRKYILENFHIKEIRCLGQIFSGVVTDVISLHLVQPSNFEKKTSVFNGKEELQISQTIFSENKKYNFT